MTKRVLLTAACGAAVLSFGSPSAQAAPGCNPSLPVVAHHTGGKVVPAAKLPTVCAVRTGYATSESSLAVAGDGSLIYSPAETENSMARSSDAGASWQLTYPAAEQPTSFWNTVDPFVIADRRTGAVFWTHATGPIRNEGSLPQVNPLPQGAGFYLAAAQGFQVYASRDDGRSWSTADYSSAPTGDWEKLAVGPPTQGGPKPSGYADVVYLCANSPFEVSGPGRVCYRSLDGGQTFSIAGFQSPSTSEPTDVCQPLNFNVPSVGPDGAIYQPASCQQGDYVAVSHDEGATYMWFAGPAPAGENMQTAVDDAGNLYAMWADSGLLYLSVSRDHAKSWGPKLMIAAPGVTGVDLPELAAGAPGHVAVSYYAGPSASAASLTAYITQTADALDTRPLFLSGALNDPAHPIFHDYGLPDAPRTDFVGGQYDKAGDRYWAGVVEQLGPPDANEDVPTVGLVGTLR